VTGAPNLREPLACTEGERREFARLVRLGFPAAERLDERIRAARCLAFHYAAPGTLAAVAALKAPDERQRRDVFAQADAPVGHGEFALELGWVFVMPTYRGSRIATRLCRMLLAHVPAAPVYATTRTDNGPMASILLALGFTRAGTPYRRRDEELALFLRAPPE
jgi:ribosomal protein S18 acetylase RimI-like enzyme